MSVDTSSFIRCLELDSIGKTLRLHQKTEGDVSCVVWDASLVLAKYLEIICQYDKTFLKGKNVIELGSGVGCAGLTAACLGANVVLSDLPAVLPLTHKNVHENSSNWRDFDGKVQAVSLEWGETINLPFTPDIILLADCIYYKESIVPLINTLKQLSGPNTKILLSQEMRDSENQRHTWQYFLESMKEYFRMDYVPLSEQHNEYSSGDITLLKISKL